MSANIPNHFVQQFTTNLQMLLQQKDSRLRSAVTTGSYVGEQAAVVDQVGAIEMQDVVGRFSPMGRVDAAVDRRWVTPGDFDLPQLIDSFDELRLITDPKSVWVQNAVAAAKRKQDRLILEAFFGIAKTGKKGETNTSFPGSQVIAVNHAAASNVGMTVAKLREAKKMLLAAEVDLDTDSIYCAMTAEQLDNLFAEAQVVSTDFNDRPVLVDGKLTRFMGINFIHSELIPVDGSNYRRVPIWAKSGMHLGVWKDVTTDISQRKDLTGIPWQLYLKMSMGATRTEEKKIIEVKCAE